MHGTKRNSCEYRRLAHLCGLFMGTSFLRFGGGQLRLIKWLHGASCNPMRAVLFNFLCRLCFQSRWCGTRRANTSRATWTCSLSTWTTRATAGYVKVCHDIISLPVSVSRYRRVVCVLDHGAIIAPAHINLCSRCGVTPAPCYATQALRYHWGHTPVCSAAQGLDLQGPLLLAVQGLQEMSAALRPINLQWPSIVDHHLYTSCHQLHLSEREPRQSA